MPFPRAAFAIAATLLTLLVATFAKAESVRVLAAASMSDVVEALARDYSRNTSQTTIQPVFAGSGVLARQIAQGVPADLYISANSGWVSWLHGRDIGIASQVVASNTLVWISRDAEIVANPITAGGRIALADPDAVPAGQYARQSLRQTGQWQQVEGRLVLAANVRDALGWVIRGHAPLGIAYATDAVAYPELFTHPINAKTHDRISYETLTLTPAGAGFFAYLMTQDAQAIFASFGFLPPS